MYSKKIGRGILSNILTNTKPELQASMSSHTIAYRDRMEGHQKGGRGIVSPYTFSH